MKDNFSTQADVYARYRPDYPSALFDFILSFVKEKELAWDCGTGNGQSALPLSAHFKKVFATDISQKQLDNAVKKDNIIYANEPAEKTSLPGHSVDLITVSQAIHWFKFDEFYAEARRVAKPGAVIAAWTYNLLHTSKEIDQVIRDYNSSVLGEFWDPERKYVDDGLKNLPFPFAAVKTPEFRIELSWSLARLEGFLNTWSALQKFIAANSYNPVGELMGKIRQHWGKEETRRIIFPIDIRLGVVE